jgi:hypothetical protein
LQANYTGWWIEKSGLSNRELYDIAVWLGSLEP